MIKKMSTAFLAALMLIGACFVGGTDASANGYQNPDETQSIIIVSPVVTKHHAIVQTARRTRTHHGSHTHTVTVYITRTGNKYHRAGCRYLRQSKIAISLSSAKSNGYTPCSVCNPPG